MNKAVFLDRDGVINKSNLYYTFKKEDFVFNEGIPEALKNFTEKGYLIFVITNQSGVAKKLYSNADVDSVHAYMITALKEHGVEIAEIYHCPHHPDFSKCICRKPDSLLLEKCIARFNIDCQRSFFIGDRQRDIDAAKKAGVNGILVDENSDIRKIISHAI